MLTIRGSQSFCSLLVMSFVTLAAQQAVADKCSVENNIRDYYLSIPPDALRIADDVSGYLESRAELDAAIEVLDTRNGYIRLQNETIISSIEIALYRDSERRPVMLITEDGVSVQNIAAFNCFNNEWHEVTASVFPEVPRNEIYELYRSTQTPMQGGFPSEKNLLMAAHTLVRYRLPRFGRNITAIASHPNVAAENHRLFEFEPDLESLVWE